MTIAHLKGELFQVSGKCLNCVLPMYLYISKMYDFHE